MQQCARVRMYTHGRRACTAVKSTYNRVQQEKAPEKAGVGETAFFYAIPLEGEGKEGCEGD